MQSSTLGGAVRCRLGAGWAGFLGAFALAAFAGVAVSGGVVYAMGGGVGGGDLRGKSDSFSITKNTPTIRTTIPMSTSLPE